MAIENIQKKEEVKTSKIKKAFKRMKNAFIVGTAALMITCGGEDTSSSNPNNKLPADVEAYADELGLYDYGSTPYQADEKPIFSKLNEYCNSKHTLSSVEAISDYVNGYKIDNNDTQIKEFLFRTGSETEALFPELLSRFIHDSYKKRLASGPNGMGVYLDSLKVRFMRNDDLSGFSYLETDYKDSDLKEAPYLFFCRIRSKIDESGISFGRVIVVPNNMFWDAVDEGTLSKEEVTKRIKSNLSRIF